MGRVRIFRLKSRDHWFKNRNQDHIFLNCLKTILLVAKDDNLAQVGLIIVTDLSPKIDKLDIICTN